MPNLFRVKGKMRVLKVKTSYFYWLVIGNTLHGPTQISAQIELKPLIKKQLHLKQEESARERALCQLTECF